MSSEPLVYYKLHNEVKSREVGSIRTNVSIKYLNWATCNNCLSLQAARGLALKGQNGLTLKCPSLALGTVVNEIVILKTHQLYSRQ